MSKNLFGGYNFENLLRGLDQLEGKKRLLKFFLRLVYLFFDTCFLRYHFKFYLPTYIRLRLLRLKSYISMNNARIVIKFS